MQTVEKGTLYVVSTPIGNLEDMSFRAIQVLKDVDLIAAEDTRKTQRLMNHFNIQNRMDSYHDHNKESKAPLLVQKLCSGYDIAVVSDAGTPGISDPAYRLIQKALASNISITPIPGPTAAITAVSVSGLPTDRFVFEGFLPVKKGRRSRIEAMKEEKRTIIFYESPHRFIKTLYDLQDIMGNRSVAVCREMTKMFEEVIRGTFSEVIEIFSKRKIRGELVLVVQGNKGKKA